MNEVASIITQLVRGCKGISKIERIDNITYIPMIETASSMIVLYG